MIRWMAPLAAFLAGCGGCVSSHGRDDAGSVTDATIDAGMDAETSDAMLRDVGSPLPDGPLPDGTDCSEVAGFRRCAADQCPYLCPGRVPPRCSNAVPLCLPRRSAEEDPSCMYDIGELGELPDYCERGDPCVMSGDVPAEDEQWGACLDAEDIELCLTDYRDVDLPPFHCVWTDMTPITQRPPSAACPSPAHPDAPFCSGACSDQDCPACIGLSDTRGFGVCVASTFPCYEDMPSFLRNRIEECSRDHGVPCACMVLTPQPADAPFPRGNVVVADACLGYEGIYPDGVQCRDADWVLLAGSSE